VIDVKLPTDLPIGIKMAADAIKRQSSSIVSISSLLPVGLGTRGGEFNKVYLDTFTRIVLRGEDIKGALDTEAANLRRIMQETKAPCWAPDPASSGPCPVN
jgi:multiple sugar transport system substrate-binding protein